MSFFKKPAWAQAGKSKPATQPEFYRRATQMYSDIIAIESDESSSDDGIKSKASVVYKESDVKKGKRRRISQDDDEEDNNDSDEAASTEEQPQPEAKPVELVNTSSESEICEIKPVPRTAPVTPSRRGRGVKYSPRSRRTYSKSPIKRRKSPNTTTTATTIRIDSASPPARSRSNSKPISLQESENDGDDETDDEYAELARQARARVQNRSQSAQRQSTPNPNLTSPSNGVHKSPTRSQHRSPSATNENGTKYTTAADDPVMSILITSDLENTTPLIVHRKLSQNLGEVRKAWCKRQKFSEEITASFFLTWRGRRLFDVTTCRSLGIGDVEESLFASTQGFFAVDGVSGISMTAITAGAFEEQKRRAAMSLAREEEEDEEADVQEVEKTEPPMQLILKSPDMEELQVKVRPTTELSKVELHFRKMRSIAFEKTVILLFDGDKLDLNSSVQDTELDDLDCIDVLVK